MRALKYELGCPLPYTRYQQCREDREELKNTFCSVNDPVAREQYWLLKMKDKQPGEYRAVKRNEIFNVFDWSQLLPRLVPVPIKDYGVKTTLDTKTRRTTLDQFYSIIVLWEKKKNLQLIFYSNTHYMCTKHCLLDVYILHKNNSLFEKNRRRHNKQKPLVQNRHRTWCSCRWLLKHISVTVHGAETHKR